MKNSPLIYKLLVVNLVVIGFVMAMMWLAVDTLAAGYFVTLMEKYHISPEPAHEMFVGAVHRYLVWACLAAVMLAVLLSFLMMRRVLAPLTRMIATTGEIAAGDFSARVPADGTDEVGKLARAFNDMAAGLEKIEKLRRTLMIDVAHELRTPLTNIRGYLEALNDDLVPPSRDTFGLLQDETLRLSGLVEDVLRLAKADAARGRLIRGPMDLAQAVREALAPFEGSMEQKGIAATVHGDDNTVVEADSGKVERILRNMMDNAVRYAPSNSSLDIGITSKAGQVQVTFCNDAPHLSVQDLPLLFERFYRGEKSRSREHGGAGIGLAIVKELVNAHGGHVGARLNGQHIEIWFSLPALQPGG